MSSRLLEDYLTIADLTAATWNPLKGARFR
jgi:hypothetical protein